MNRLVWRAMMIVVIVAACSRVDGPQAVAAAYGKALYAYDAATIHRLASAPDRSARDEGAVQTQLGAPNGFALELLRQLGSFVVTAPVSSQIVGRRATVTMKFRLPDANAPAVKTLAHDWDESALEALPATERGAIKQHLDDLHRHGTLPVVEGNETFELVKESDGWHMVLDWAGGIAVRFAASTTKDVPLELSVAPAELHVKRGESFRVTVRATNVSTHEVTARVGHQITPSADAHFLALVQCPLFLPTTLKPGESRDFTSEYLLLRDAPETATFGVGYTFARPTDAASTGNASPGIPSARWAEPR
jgi:hypothetical protein